MITHENQFGMFIHWGIYSITGLQDQAIIRYDMDQKEYESLAKQFNPTEYDPENWVLLAKEAGMKYICFTTKHHDGFCMWNTAYTDYNIMNTPYGKDVLKMLADACAKHGMKLSLYYSNPDWNHKYGYNPNSSHQWRALQRERIDNEKYREYVKNQVRELLTNYGPIYSFFWDITPKVYDPSLNAMVRELQPGIYINDRGYDEGDFSTPEREYCQADGKYFTRMTEACNSLGEQSWGYRAQEDFYSLRHIICSIDRIMAMGGSYLLNVGPDEKGVIQPKYADRIRKVGDWYRHMEGCLESADVDTFDYAPIKHEYLATQKNGKTYLHFPEGFHSSAVAIPNYPSVPKRVRLMNTGKELPFAVELLPEFFNLETGKALEGNLHVYGIPIDELESEAIVLEFEF
jgi:alpha-L-fucosidase